VGDGHDDRERNKIFQNVQILLLTDGTLDSGLLKQTIPKEEDGTVVPGSNIGEITGCPRFSRLPFYLVSPHVFRNCALK
jgi:hypothetical protein